jgi:hypothetical protein
MPDTSTEPNPRNSVIVGDLIVFHSDDGGFFATSRENVVVITADNRRLTDKAALWTLFQELRKLASARKRK